MEFKWSNYQVPNLGLKNKYKQKIQYGSHEKDPNAF